MDNPAESKIFKLAKRYDKNPKIRALVQLIPWGIGSAFDVALATTISNIREERARTFFDELSSRNLPLTEEEIKSEDFLHAFFTTYKAALNTRRREKIRLFAQLLHSYASNPTEIEEFEEHLAILDDLSYREFQILVCLKRYEEANPQDKGRNAHERANLLWKDFQSECTTKLGIPIGDLNGVLTRLTRTGLYQVITFDYRGDRGRLTSNFHRFIGKLEVANTE